MSLVKDCLRNYLFQLYYQELEKLVSGLTIEYAIVKGEVLSKMAYSKEGKRTGTDIDVLVSRSNIREMENCLASNGFKPDIVNRQHQVMMLSSSHQTRTWSKECGIGIMTIDLNFDIFWGEYEGRRISIDDFLYDTIDMVIYGVTVKTLSPIKSFVQLVLHHYKDMNSIYLLATKKSIKYDMFKDVYYLLINNLYEIPLEKLFSYCKEIEIVPYMYYVLYYTGCLYKDKVLNEYINRFEDSQGKFLLDKYGLNNDERKVWKFDFQTRLKEDNLFKLIKEDLTESDFNKISVNSHYFG